MHVSWDYGQVFHTDSTKKKYHDKSDLIHFLPKDISTTSPTNTNMESAKIIMRIEAKKIFDSVLGNNITFYWNVALLRIMIYDDRLKEQTDTINGKLEDNDFVVNSMEQTSKIFSSSFQNKNSIKVYIRTDIFVFIKQRLWQLFTHLMQEK